jgi:hypothetical protein
MEVYALTHREFHILMKAQREQNYDHFEREAEFVIMREKAHRAKRPKASDLYKRPNNGHQDDRELELKVEQAKEAAAWLSQFEFK